MQMPGSAIAPDVSNVLYPRLVIQAVIIFLGGTALFLALGRLALFSSQGVIFFGRRRSLARWREALFPANTSAASREPRTIRVLRISFGLLWIFDAILQAKPTMPSQMVTAVIEPALTNQPGPIAWLMRGGIYFWRFSPIAADTATVWLQLGIGLLLILGSRPPLRRLAALSSIAWGLVIWIFGEGIGMLAVPGASWLAGAPGAALFYIVVGAILLCDDGYLSSERFTKVVRVGIGAFWLAMAAIQALPLEGFWSGSALSGIFSQMSSMQMPTLLANPIAFMAKATAADPALWNLIFVGVMAMIGVGILTSKQSRGFFYASLVFAFLTWWLSMGFGFLGATGTDPNSSLPLILITVALVLVSMRAPAERTVPSYPGEPRALGAAMAVIALFVAMVPMLISLPAAASDASIYAAVSDGGGLTDLGGRAAPNFSLLDQYGNKVSLATFRHKAVVLTFLDPVCYDVCPIMASEITTGVAHLGTSASKVAMVAIDINPSFTSLAAIRQFDAEHALNGIKNWYYLTGSLHQLDKVWKDYLVSPSTGPIGMLSHPQVVYFISPRGAEVALTGDSGAPQSSLVASYSSLITSTTKITLAS